MKRRTFLTALAGVAGMMAASGLAAAPQLPKVDVFKSPYCGCCTQWVEHLQKEGFAVEVTMVDDVAAVRTRLGMPASLASCHTATVGGYVLEGHVPAREVKKLLTEKRNALGLTVPGMPAGSPGMEMGGRQDAFQVLLVSKDGKSTPYATYPQR
jgi:hypothetical protein